MRQSCLFCLDRCNTRITICDDCQLLLPWQTNACFTCALPLQNTMAQYCGQCIKKPPPLYRSISLFTYDTPIAQIIKQIKFVNKVSLSKLLGKLWMQYLSQNNIEIPDCILPVPLHPKRIKERGFNQAIEIAKPISKNLKIPLDRRSCIRIKNTKPQSMQSGKKRLTNVKNAFALSHRVDYKHVVIFDDVMTTGKTIFEIAKLLQTNGVKKIEAWTCARVNNH